MSRGIISIYWGDASRLPIDRLRASVKKFHPELPHEIIKVDAPVGSDLSLNRKAEMYDLSPFDETLYLDLDTVVLGDLGFGFEKAQKHGLAIAMCEAPWARRYSRIFSGDQIEYNTGVIFFTSKAKCVFDKWKHLSGTVDSSIVHLDENGKQIVMASNDQGSFALAVEESGFNPFVLPLNWNFRPPWQLSFYGPIKIWHAYPSPPPFLEKIGSYYTNKNSIIQFHQIKISGEK